MSYRASDDKARFRKIGKTGENIEGKSEWKMLMGRDKLNKYSKENQWKEEKVWTAIWRTRFVK